MAVGNMYRKDGRELLFEDAKDQIILLLEPGRQVAFFHDSGTLMKHGEARAVEAYAETIRSRMKSEGYQDAIYRMETIVIDIREVTDEMVEELNACIHVTGRVGRLKERLAAFRQAARDAAHTSEMENGRLAYQA